MKLTSVAVKLPTEQLRLHSSRFVFPQGYTGVTLDSLIASFARAYIQSLLFQAPPSYGYYSGGRPSNMNAILAALDWCITMKYPALFGTVVQQFTNQEKLTKQYLTDILVPFLPELWTWALKYSALNAVAPAFQRAMSAWTDVALGAPPAANATLATQLQGLARWTCSCEHCPTARAFLSQQGGPSTQLTRIGAPKRRRVEQQLLTHARSLVTFQMISTVPQGLTVSICFTITRLLC